MKITVLDAKTLGDDISLDLFSEIGELDAYPLTDRSEIADRISDSDVVVINKVKLDEEVLKNAKNLKLICVAATGYDNIDTNYCKQNNVAVCNVAGYSANSVSQLTLAMVLSASVNLDSFKNSVADGSYSRGSVQNILTPVYHELAGKVWGIVGYGGIGRRVALAAEALGCRVVFNKKNQIDDENCLSLDELLTISDIVTVHVPLNNETRGMIGERELDLMKDGAFLVNVARGAVTDEMAVANAVISGKLGFFGCDVYSTEPMPESHPFYQIRNHKNVTLTPHMAWGAYESRVRCLEEIKNNIIAFNNGEKRNRIV